MGRDQEDSFKSEDIDHKHMHQIGCALGKGDSFDAPDWWMLVENEKDIYRRQVEG